MQRNQNVPASSPILPLNPFRSSNTLFLPFSINASNFTVNAAMRSRSSEKLKSGVGSCVDGSIIGPVEVDVERDVEKGCAFCGAMVVDGIFWVAGA
jgi:hypothetical protein